MALFAARRSSLPLGPRWRRALCTVWALALLLAGLLATSHRGAHGPGRSSHGPDTAASAPGHHHDDAWQHEAGSAECRLLDQLLDGAAGAPAPAGPGAVQLADAPTTRLRLAARSAPSLGYQARAPPLTVIG